MRFLIVDHFYQAFVESVYGAHPGLAFRPYSEQRARLDDGLFGETVFEVSALQALGHEAWDSLANVRPLQAAWLREHGRPAPPERSWGLRLRRGLVPWPQQFSDRWIGAALLEQVRILKPDVLHLQVVDLLDEQTVARLREHVRLVVGQIAAPLRDERVLSAYDLVVSSLPNFVERFRRQGVDAEWLPLAFEPSLVALVGARQRDIPVSFVGSLSSKHLARVEFLESVARRADLSIWTGDANLPAGSPLAECLQGPAWGRQMYEVMARSRLTLNSHIDVAAGFSNNLRLYEATGMGALLVTDSGSNLSDLFEPEREVVTYTSPSDCAEKVEYYLGNPAEAAAIAAAGQARTLRDHTWRDRMGRLAKFVEARL